MSSRNERPAVMLGLLVLFGLAVASAVLPMVGYVLLGLECLLIVGGITAFVVAWRRTRWQPLDDRHLVRLSTPVTRVTEREVA